MESIFGEEVAIRPSLVFFHGIAVPFGRLRASQRLSLPNVLSLSKRFAPEPLAKSPADEVVHLREAAMVVFPGKVVAPATASFVDLRDDFAGRLPGGVTPRQFAHPVSEGLLCGRTRFGMHIRRLLFRGLPAEGKTRGTRSRWCGSEGPLVLASWSASPRLCRQRASRSLSPWPAPGRQRMTRSSAYRTMRGFSRHRSFTASSSGWR